MPRQLAAGGRSLRCASLLLLACLLSSVRAQAGVNEWTSNGPPGGVVLALAIDSATVYAGLDGGVFKSTNGGAAWSAVNAGLTSSYVNALAIDPTAPATVYAGYDYYGVFKSTNGGAAWSRKNKLPSDLPAIRRSLWAFGLSVDAVPIILGRADFLDRFVLTVDHSQRKVVLTHVADHRS
jgi:hypothetical protein